MSRYACVADQKAAGFPVTKACEIAEVSTSGFYDWLKRDAAGPTERQLADDALVELIREIFDAVSMAKLMSSLVAIGCPRWWPTKVLASRAPCGWCGG